MTKHQLTKTAAALLAATLVFGNTAWAETGTGNTVSGTNTAASTAALKRFPDVAFVHWASKHITKLALLGIVEGNEKGQYQPESRVTQEQVLAMAIRMMGLEAEAKALPAFYSELEVSEYAKPYLHMALEKGLIDWQEEKTLSGTSKWGVKNATREWVAKLSVRAIGKQEEALKHGAKETAFTDNATISVWARGYINEAVDLKIVNGMDDGSFKPQDYVTRAQMATFLSRAGQYAPQTGSRTVIGVVESMTGQNITIVDDLGQKNTYDVTPDTVYYGLLNDTAVMASDLKANNKVYLILTEGKAVYAEVLEEQAKIADSLEGVLLQMNLEEGSATMTIKTANGDAVADLAVPPTILDTEGKGLKLSDLVTGATLELQRSGSRAKYSTIIVKHIPVNKTAEGVIQSVDMNERKLNVLEKETGAVQYPLAVNVTYLNNGAAGDLNTLRNGDTIKYRVTNDAVAHIDMVAPYVEPSDSGKLIELRSDKNISYITLQKADNQFATYAVEGDVDIVIPGMSYTSTKDLVAGDQVKVILTDKNSVSQITVTNRSMFTEFLSSVISYDADSKALTVRSMDGSLHVYELSEQTKFVMTGSTITLATAVNLLTKGKELDITASSDTHVKEIRIVTDYEGLVARADSERNELTLKLGDRLLTLKLHTGASIDLPNKTNAKLSDLTVGEKVKVVYESSLDSVVKVQAIKSASYRLTGKNTLGNQLIFKDEAGALLTLSIPYSVKLYNQAQAEISLADIPLDEPYHVEMIGSAVQKVMAAPNTRGAITSVDAAGGKITITETNGTAAKTVTVGTDAKVKRDGSTSAVALADLKAGDRVEISKEPSGASIITIAQVLKKKLDYFDSATQSLYVLREYLNETRTYPFHAKAYIHKGSITVPLTSLVWSDVAFLYMVEGKIIELDKQ
jgi:trimeric autotransporter adhesin